VLSQAIPELGGPLELLRFDGPAEFFAQLMDR
jgi:hypothetical protein